MRITILSLALILTAPALGQTIYKCPSPTPGAPAVIQQMPCSPTGGGESMAVKPIQTTGSTLEVNAQGQAFMQDNRDRWAAQAEAAEKERQRQEALGVERAKVRAAEEQAAAQRATARAIGAARLRW